MAYGEPVRTDYQFTSEELIAAIKKQPAKTRFYIMGYQSAPIVCEPDTVFRDAISFSVKLSRAEALKHAKDLLSATMQQRGARIPSRMYQYPDSRSFYLV
jgi:hypothetical protein